MEFFFLNGEKERGVKEVFKLFFWMLSLHLFGGTKKNNKILLSAQWAPRHV
jgi:hypothetical protein